MSGIKLKLKMQLMILLPVLLMVGSCSTANNRSVTWPTNLEVIKLSDGGVCLSPESAKRLAEFKAHLESW